jgi:hypothetical protein
MAYKTDLQKDPRELTNEQYGLIDLGIGVYKELITIYGQSALKKIESAFQKAIHEKDYFLLLGIWKAAREAGNEEVTGYASKKMKDIISRLAPNQTAEGFC